MMRQMVGLPDRGYLARNAGHLIVSVAATAFSGCALTDRTDINALSNAATHFKSTVSGDGPAAAARSDANKARLLEFVARGQIPPIAACTPPTAEAKAFDADVASGNAASSASWQTLLKTPTCSWGLNLEPDAPGAPRTQPIISALNDYYAGVASIASATSVQQVVDAATKATTAASTLAGLVPGAAAPAKAASAIVDKLAQYSLQTAQYEALKATLGDIDAGLDQSSGPIINALRVQQGYWIEETSFFAGDGVSALHDALAAPGQPADHLAALQLAQPILDDIAAQQKSVRTDPGEAFHALVTAHHKLYAALQANKGLQANVLAAAQGIANSARSMAGTSAGPAAPAAKAAAPAAKTD